jgi:hypothetical protein
LGGTTAFVVPVAILQQGLFLYFFRIGEMRCNNIVGVKHVIAAVNGLFDDKVDQL